MSTKLFFLAVFVIFLGCSRSGTAPVDNHEFTRIDIYYRNFGALSPISYSKDDLIRLAPIKINISDDNHIDQFVHLIPDTCVPVEDPSETEMDYYLLIRLFSEDQLKRELGASSLHFLDKRISSSVCQFSQHDSKSIGDWINGYRKKG